MAEASARKAMVSSNNPTPIWPAVDQSEAGLGSITNRRDEAIDLSPQLLRQTKSEIGSQIQKLAELARTNLPPDEFYPPFLTKIISTMMATGAAVWSRDESGQWSCIAHRDLDDTLRFDFEPTDEHRSLLDRIHSDQQPVVIPPSDVPVPEGLPRNPTHQLLLYSPVPVALPEQSLWLQVVQRPSGGAATQRGYLRFVAQLADLIADYLKSNRLQTLESERSFLVASERLLDRLSRTAERDGAIRDLLDTVCSIGQANQAFLVHATMAKDGSWSVEGASGIGKVDARGEGARVIVELCRWIDQQVPAKKSNAELAASSGTIERQRHWFRAKSMEAPLKNYMELFQAERVTFLPLDPDPSRLSRSVQGQTKGPGIVAGLLLHWPDARTPKSQDSNLEFLCRIGLNTIRPAWWIRAQMQHVGWRKKMLMPTTWPQRIKLATAAVGMTLLGMIPVPWNLHAMANLQPSAVQHLYAPSDSIVTEVNVDHEERVEPGSVVLQLQDRQLASSLEENLGIQSKTQERIREVSNLLGRNEQLTPIQRDQLEGERLQLQQFMVSQRKRLGLLEAQIDALQLRSEQGGRVATWDLKRSLQNRPVRAGQRLVTIYQSDQPWYLEAHFPERDWAILEKLKGPELAVTAFLTSHPNISLTGQFKEFEQSAIPDPEDPSKKVVRVRFQVAAEELPQKREGATARVRIACGSSPLAWVLMRDVILSNWARLRLWL